jgi:CO/xanthine dehydrogenase FAD-binding subunit
MILQDFEYARPQTLDEVLALLREGEGVTLALAGGTDLLPNVRTRYVRPDLLVSLAGLDADVPQLLDDGTLRLDALTRLCELERLDVAHSAAPMIATAAHTVAGNQIRQRGTLGGNLCQENRCHYMNQDHDYQFVVPCYKRGGDACYPFPGNPPDTCWSVYCSDLAPVLIALGAELEIAAAAGPRRLPLAQLYSGDALHPLTLARGELLRAVQVPALPEGSGWGYHKSTVRGGMEFGAALLAVVLQLDADRRTCRTASIVIGAVGEGPLRPAHAEQALLGAALDAELLASAAERASREIDPLPHHGFNKQYLRENIRVHLHRTLQAAFARAAAAA